MTNITEDYVSFETAKLLKKKGFDEPCECLYDTENNDVSIVNGWMNSDAKPKTSLIEGMRIFRRTKKPVKQQLSIVLKI